MNAWHYVLGYFVALAIMYVGWCGVRRTNDQTGFWSYLLLYSIPVYIIGALLILLFNIIREFS